MFGLPRFHRWRTLCTARLCAGGPMRIGESRRCHRQTFCLSRVSLVTAAARCRWRNVDCRRVSCNGSGSSRHHLIELMDTHGPDLLPDHVRVSATWSQTSRRRYQLCAPVLTASARQPAPPYPSSTEPSPAFARASVRLPPAPAGFNTETGVREVRYFSVARKGLRWYSCVSGQ